MQFTCDEDEPRTYSLRKTRHAWYTGSGARSGRSAIQRRRRSATLRAAWGPMDPCQGRESARAACSAMRVGNLTGKGWPRASSVRISKWPLEACFKDGFLKHGVERQISNPFVDKATECGPGGK